MYLNDPLLFPKINNLIYDRMEMVPCTSQFIHE